jgi:hypothetical protein
MNDFLPNNTMIARYPKTTELSISLRSVPASILASLLEGVSEFTFANLCLLRNGHSCMIALIGDGCYVVTGSDRAPRGRFFMLSSGLLGPKELQALFRYFGYLKVASQSQVQLLRIWVLLLQRTVVLSTTYT